jgi:hypothetical protein
MRARILHEIAPWRGTCFLAPGTRPDSDIRGNYQEENNAK